MSLNFKWFQDNSEISEFLLDDKGFTLLKPAFEELKKKTGLKIDPYKDTRISPDLSEKGKMDSRLRMPGMTPADGRDFMKDQGKAPFSSGKKFSSGHVELKGSVHHPPFSFFSQHVRLI